MSGSLKLSSDTSDLPLGALLFEKDGTMKLMLLDTEENSETDNIKLISDYFQYALENEEWMSEYIDLAVEASEAESTNTPFLKVIQGGLSSLSETEKD